MRGALNSVSQNIWHGVWVLAQGRDDEGICRLPLNQRDKFCNRKSSAVAANTCMLASRSALPVSSVIAADSGPANPMQLWPAASPERLPVGPVAPVSDRPQSVEKRSRIWLASNFA